MKKLFIIGLKDLKLVFRDKPALIMMLLAPFLLTLGLGFISGRFSGGSNTGISNIPVVLVNQDRGQLGQSLVDVFHSKGLADLITPFDETDLQTARQMIDDNKAAVAIFIPDGFTESIIPTDPIKTDQVVMLDLYTNPTMPTSVGVVKAIVDEVISQVEVGRVTGEVVVMQLIRNGLIQPQDAIRIGMETGVQGAADARASQSIILKTSSNDGGEAQFDILAYMAPGMALMFLMFTVTNGGRSLLAEQVQGTLPRILVSPTQSSQVLGGKIFGIFLTGTSQMLILILASTLLFQIKWGDPAGVLVLVVTSTLGAVGWGLILTSIIKTPGQLSAIGTALMLIFGVLGGSFVNREILPNWLKTLSLITPNAWGLDGFQTLALGGGLKDILTPIVGLLTMGVLLFLISILLFNRRGLVKG